MNAGNYTTKVIFNNPHYNNIINNTNLTIFKSESNLKIYEIGNVTYGDDIYIKFYDDYPTVFNINIINKDDIEEFNVTFVYEDKSPEMSIIFADLSAGEYKVYMKNIGDRNIIGSTSYMFFNVTKATPIIEVDTIDVSYPEDVIVLINTTVRGNYTVKIGNQTQMVFLEADELNSIIFSNLSANICY